MTCRSCGASVFFAATDAGRRMILESRPDPERGNVRVETGGGRVLAVLGPLEADAARAAGEMLHLDHHATCPDRERWTTKTTRRGAG